MYTFRCIYFIFKINKWKMILCNLTDVDCLAVITKINEYKKSKNKTNKYTLQGIGKRKETQTRPI